MTASHPVSARDPRIDLMRGLALLSIYVDHIPGNWLADITLHNFGFSDAAEIFVLLAGFSATHAYNSVFDRRGLRVGLSRVFVRCLQIYGVQVLLLLATLASVGLWERIYGTRSIILGPLLRDGWHGALRGVSLRALPAYLDILPLYILLLLAFPVIRFGMARSPGATLCASATLYAAANLWHLNLRNIVDPADAAHWYFNPFTWQLLFVLGSGLALALRRQAPLMSRPPAALRALCWIYVVGAFLVLDAWKLWPPPLPGDFYATSPLLGIFGNEPKTYVSPWRLFDVLAIAYLVLTSEGMRQVATWRPLHPLLACGRNSLSVFALGCILSLFGRLTFRTYGVTVDSQIVVNVLGLGVMLMLGVALDTRKVRRASRQHEEITSHVPREAV